MLNIVVQTYSIIVYLWNLPIPVGVFVYCYGRIFHTIRRQSSLTVRKISFGVIDVIAYVSTVSYYMRMHVAW